MNYLRYMSTVCVALIVTCAASAQGIKYFDPDDDVANWEESEWNITGCGGGGGLVGPTEVQAAVICGGTTCTMTADHEVVRVDVNSTGILNINSGKTLTLNGTGVTSDIDGTMNVTGALALDWADPISATHTFTGDGKINGTATGAELAIEGYDNTFTKPEVTLSTTISGIVHIYESNSELVWLILNGGTIKADGNGDLHVELGMVRDVATSHLKVASNSNARLLWEVRGNCSGGITCVGPCLEYTDVEILQGIFTYKYGFTTEKLLAMGGGGRIVISDTAIGLFDAPSNQCN